MTFEQAKTSVEAKGWKIIAQSCHEGGLLSYDAMKGSGTDKWPHRRKLAKGLPRKTAHGAMTALLASCIDRDLPTYRRRVVRA